MRSAPTFLVMLHQGGFSISEQHEPPRAEWEILSESVKIACIALPKKQRNALHSLLDQMQNEPDVLYILVMPQGYWSEPNVGKGIWQYLKTNHHIDYNYERNQGMPQIPQLVTFRDRNHLEKNVRDIIAALYNNAIVDIGGTEVKWTIYEFKLKEGKMSEQKAVEGISHLVIPIKTKGITLADNTPLETASGMFEHALVIHDEPRKVDVRIVVDQNGEAIGLVTKEAVDEELYESQTASESVADVFVFHSGCIKVDEDAPLQEVVDEVENKEKILEKTRAVLVISKSNKKVIGLMLESDLWKAVKEHFKHHHN